MIVAEVTFVALTGTYFHWPHSIVLFLVQEEEVGEQKQVQKQESYLCFAVFLLLLLKCFQYILLYIIYKNILSNHIFETKNITVKTIYFSTSDLEPICDTLYHY